MSVNYSNEIISIFLEYKLNELTIEQVNQCFEKKNIICLNETIKQSAIRSVFQIDINEQRIRLKPKMNICRNYLHRKCSLRSNECKNFHICRDFGQCQKRHCHYSHKLSQHIVKQWNCEHIDPVLLVRLIQQYNHVSSMVNQSNQLIDMSYSLSSMKIELIDEFLKSQDLRIAKRFNSVITKDFQRWTLQLQDNTVIDELIKTAIIPYRNSYLKFKRTNSNIDLKSFILQTTIDRKKGPISIEKFSQYINILVNRHSFKLTDLSSSLHQILLIECDEMIFDFNQLCRLQNSRRQLQGRNIALKQIYQYDLILISSSNISLSSKFLENLIQSIDQMIFAYHIITNQTASIEFLRHEDLKQWLLQNSEKIKQQYQVDIQPSIKYVDENEITTTTTTKDSAIYLGKNRALIIDHSIFGVEYKTYIKSELGVNVEIEKNRIQLCTMVMSATNDLIVRLRTHTNIFMKQFVFRMVTLQKPREQLEILWKYSAIVAYRRNQGNNYLLALKSSDVDQLMAILNGKHQQKQSSHVMNDLYVDYDIDQTITETTVLPNENRAQTALFSNDAIEKYLQDYFLENYYTTFSIELSTNDSTHRLGKITGARYDINKTVTELLNIITLFRVKRFDRTTDENWIEISDAVRVIQYQLNRRNIMSLCHQETSSFSIVIYYIDEKHTKLGVSEKVIEKLCRENLISSKCKLMDCNKDRTIQTYDVLKRADYKKDICLLEKDQTIILYGLPHIVRELQQQFESIDKKVRCKIDYRSKKEPATQNKTSTHLSLIGSPNVSETTQQIYPTVTMRTQKQHPETNPSLQQKPRIVSAPVPQEPLILNNRPQKKPSINNASTQQKPVTVNAPTQQKPPTFSASTLQSPSPASALIQQKSPTNSASVPATPPPVSTPVQQKPPTISTPTPQRPHPVSAPIQQKPPTVSVPIQPNASIFSEPVKQTSSKHTAPTQEQSPIYTKDFHIDEPGFEVSLAQSFKELLAVVDSKCSLSHQILHQHIQIQTPQAKAYEFDDDNPNNQSGTFSTQSSTNKRSNWFRNLFSRNKSKTQSSQSTSPTSGHTSPSLTIGKSKIIVCMGDLTKQAVDLIVVCSTSTILCDAITSAAGSNVKDISKQKLSNLIRTFDTPGGNLPCKKIFFHPFSYERNNSQTLKQVIESFVSTAILYAINNNLSTIALPSVGCGKLAHDPKQIAEYMLIETHRQLKDHPHLLLNISFVLLPSQKNVYDAFADQLQAISNLDDKPICLSFDRQTVKITLTGTDKNLLITCESQIRALAQTSSHKVHLTGQTDLSTWPQNTIQKYYEFCLQKRVLPTLDINNSIIDLVVPKDAIFEAEKYYYQLTTETLRNTRIQSLSNGFHWIVEISANRHEQYSNKIITQLENAFTRNLPHVDFINDQSEKCRVVFSTMEEEYGKRKRKVYRKAIDSSLPSNWLISNENFKRVDLSYSSSEYQDVLNRFNITMKNQYLKIISIERIQNKRWYKQYAIHREEFVQRYKQPDERRLFHGCHRASAEKIIHECFNRSFAGVNGTVYGGGVYFHENAKYSHSFTRPDSGGIRTMFLADVLIGKTCIGDSSMRVPPDGFDTTSDGQHIFVVYHDAAAYGHYLITYQANT